MMVMVLQKYDIVGIKQMQMAGCDKDKGLPLPRVSCRRSLVKPNKLFWLLPKLFVFVHWGQTEWEQYDTGRGTLCSRWAPSLLRHFPHHGAAHLLNQLDSQNKLILDPCSGKSCKYYLGNGTHAIFFSSQRGIHFFPTKKVLYYNVLRWLSCT